MTSTTPATTRAAFSLTGFGKESNSRTKRMIGGRDSAVRRSGFGGTPSRDWEVRRSRLGGTAVGIRRYRGGGSEVRRSRSGVTAHGIGGYSAGIAAYNAVL